MFTALPAEMQALMSRTKSCYLVSICLLTWFTPVAVAAGDAAAAPPWTEAEKQTGYVVFSHSAFQRLPTELVPQRETIVSNVSCVLARNEYESLQIGVHAVSGDLQDVRLEIESPLPVEVYHGDAAEVDERGFRKNPPKETGIVWEPPDVVLVRDNLVKVVPQGKSINFWLTFHADLDAPVGPHAGRIRIQAEGRPQTVVDLVLRVRPFRLGRARIAFGIYWPDNSWPQHLQTDQQWTAAYRDMAQHGQTSISIYDYSPWFKLEPEQRRLIRCLTLAGPAGVTHEDIPCVWLYGGGTMNDETARTEAATWLSRECRERGWPSVILYGPDEPSYPNPQVREGWLPWRQIPIPVGTAISAQSVYGHSDLFDVWIVRVDGITPELAAEAKRMGAQLWCYDHRIRSWHPLQFRYMTGLFTWATQVKGNYTWCGGSYALMWWPEVGARPMPMLGWEARREGVDDYRYLQLLEDAIAEKGDDIMAIEAAAWLESLRIRCIVDPMKAEPGKPLALAAYERIRDRASTYIEKLGPVSDEAIKAAPLARQPDEAAPLRHETTEQCIAQLASTDVKTRRAAAWALFERGPAARAATEPLADLLDDPELRMVCLRAIEAIGPDAYVAIPRVTALLSHPDPFVRIGATFALGTIGAFPMAPPRPHEVAPPAPTPSAPAVAEALRAALHDDSAMVVQVAGRGLSRLGPIAAAALPDAISLLDHAEGGRRSAAYTLIAGFGSQADAAVPMLISIVNAKQGNASGELTCLAAIGPPAKDAVSDLVKWRSQLKDGQYWLRSRISYALFCIRSDTKDLHYMVRLMTDHNVPDWEMQHIMTQLHAVGAAAAPVAEEIRSLVEANKYPGFKERLEDILQRIENNEAPTRLMP